ncbi:hypothetical protein EVB99_013 [Rhizobium phage RHph_N3_19]|nr:hypothetical protein EVB99_013 [Rhizobium phage RHph_N3_19]
MFNVGDIVRCINDQVPYFNGLVNTRHPRLSESQRFEIVRTTTWGDGSQSLWLQYRPKSKSTLRAGRGGYDETTIRGPYCHLRFELETPSEKYQYDPNQTGDTDEDI